jgi:hypothetical protein
MKSIVLVLAMVGIILIAVGYVKSNLQCPPPTIQYRYISKTFDDEQNYNQPLTSISSINSMFNDDSPWFNDKSYSTTNIKEK